MMGDALTYKKKVTLRTVAERVGLAPCTVSSVLNDTHAARSIPQRTKDRVLRAAAELNYRPNLSARSLRTNRTYMVAVVGADFGRASVARVVSGMERRLRRRGYLLVIGAFGSAAEWSGLSVEFQQRGIDGVISIGTRLPREPECPAVAVGLRDMLGTMEVHEPFSEEVGAWLTDLGEAAVDAVLQKIESKSAPRAKVAAKIPPAYFGVPGVGLGGQAAAMGD
jgi:transcriptional regulator with XRE-family HTH domain